MASNPPAQCCTVGVRHEGEPTGTTTTIDDLEVYIAEPKGNNVKKDTAILYLPDVISIWQNSKLIADQFAENGYYCFMPDLFQGDPIPLNRPADFDIMKWLTQGNDGKHPHTWQHVDPVVEQSIKYLREKKGIKHLGAVGYCFGAKYVVRYMPKGKGIDVGYVAHPSFVEESELSTISGPLSIAAAETDQIFPPEKRHKSEEILKETKLPYQINLYSSVEHGFAVRCELEKKVQRFAKEQAFYQAVQWFDTWLGQGE